MLVRAGTVSRFFARAPQFRDKSRKANEFLKPLRGGQLQIFAEQRAIDVAGIRVDFGRVIRPEPTIVAPNRKPPETRTERKD
jgi:hypothetical protein